MLGRFHEVSITTADIRAAVEFYEALGFTQASTTDAWPYPYGVLSDGRLAIGLHQGRAPAAAPAPPARAAVARATAQFALTFVLPGVAAQRARFEQLGIELSVCRTGDEVFNEVGFRDPFGQEVHGLEARTYSPVDRQPDTLSLCGYFAQVSLPAADFEAARAFWEPLGFVAMPQVRTPYVHLPLTSDYLDLAFHRPRTFAAPLLVFRDPQMPERLARLRELGINPTGELPQGVAPEGNAIVESPDGTLLLLLQEAG